MAEQAASRGVSGWVRNMTDGSVQAFLEGEDEKVMRVVEWAKHGPPRARVDSVKVERVRLKNSKSFRIEG
jgi:acylphosphatase